MQGVCRPLSKHYGPQACPRSSRALSGAVSYHQIWYFRRAPVFERKCRRSSVDFCKLYMTCQGLCPRATTSILPVCIPAPSLFREAVTCAGSPMFGSYICNAAIPKNAACGGSWRNGHRRSSVNLIQAEPTSYMYRAQLDARCAPLAVRTYTYPLLADESGRPIFLFVRLVIQPDQRVRQEIFNNRLSSCSIPAQVRPQHRMCDKTKNLDSFQHGCLVYVQLLRHGADHLSAAEIHYRESGAEWFQRLDSTENIISTGG